MQIFYCDQFVLPLPEDHRFPIAKYALLRQRILDTGLVEKDELQVPDPASDEQIRRVHSAEYLQKVISGSLSEKEIRRIGFPWSPGLVERSRRSVGGTIAACRSALQDMLAVNLAGGTHHAYPDHGEGFCVFNDCATAARAMQAEQLARLVLIVDLDVHQGNGTAAIFENDPSVFTFSVHGEKNFPFHKERSDLDIALGDGADDDNYLETVRIGLQQCELRFEPELVLYLAGSDPFSGDRLGRMQVSKSGLAARDCLVFEWCQRHRVPMAIVMAGGYARDVADTVDIHFNTVKTAIEFSRKGTT